MHTDDGNDGEININVNLLMRYQIIAGKCSTKCQKSGSLRYNA